MGAREGNEKNRLETKAGFESRERETSGDGRELRWDKSLDPVDGPGFTMRVKSAHNSPGEYSDDGWFYTLGTLTATPEKVEFTSRRENTYVDFDAIEVIQHRNDRISSLIWIGTIIAVFGILVLLSSFNTGLFLILLGGILAAVGKAKRGDSVFLVTGNKELEYRTINRDAARRAVSELKELKKTKQEKATLQRPDERE